MLFFVIASWLNPSFTFQSNQSLKIEATDSLSDFSQNGSAVLIDPRIVLTAAHVLAFDIRNAVNSEIKVFCGGQQFSATLVKINYKSDLALLSLIGSCDSVVPSTLAKENPQYLEPMVAITCPNAMCGLANSGIVSGFADATMLHGMWMFSDMPIFFGSSGGGAFNMSGELIGICSRIQNFTKQVKHKEKKHEIDLVTDQYSVWIPVSEIRIFLGI